jgi:hypothetical protein
MQMQLCLTQFYIIQDEWRARLYWRRSDGAVDGELDGKPAAPDGAASGFTV